MQPFLPRLRARRLCLRDVAGRPSRPQGARGANTIPKRSRGRTPPGFLELFFCLGVTVNIVTTIADFGRNR